MRFVSSTNTFTLDCTGNVLPNAMILASVDSNKSNELLVGTQDGELLIFKANRSQNGAVLWRRATGLGFITAVTVGCLATGTSDSRPIICVVNAEGAIHLFVLRSTNQRNRVRSAGGTITSGSRNDSKLQLHGLTTPTEEEQQQQQLQMPVAFSQQLICNPKMLFVQDVGENEKQLIIGYCDRTIRVFTSMIIEDFDSRLAGRFLLKFVFSIANQIQTLNSKRLSTKDYELIISQPGGNLLRFNPNEDNNRILATDVHKYDATGWTEAIALETFHDGTIYATVCNENIRNTVSVTFEDDRSCILDLQIGHLDMFSAQLDRVIHSISLSNKTGHSGNLCGLRKGPVAKDGYNQLVTVSSMNGDTFIVDRHLDVVRFRPPISSSISSSGDSISSLANLDQIQAFTSGILGENNMYCFVYAMTHSEKIVIVHSLELGNARTTNLLTTIMRSTRDETLKEVVSISDRFKDLLHNHS